MHLNNISRLFVSRRLKIPNGIDSGKSYRLYFWIDLRDSSLLRKNLLGFLSKFIIDASSGYCHQKEKNVTNDWPPDSSQKAFNSSGIRSFFWWMMYLALSLIATSYMDLTSICTSALENTSNMWGMLMQEEQ